jgi:hypothetical protein
VQGAARKCPRLAWALGLVLIAPPATARAAPTPTATSAATATTTPVDPTTTATHPPEPDPFGAAAQAADAATRARLEAIYVTANEATQAGDFAAAADRYAEVLEVLAESRETHESRALALLDSVAARRQAAQSGDLAQLCRARDMTRRYLAAAFAAHALAAAELDGVRQAQQLREELDAEIAGLPAGTCPEDQVATARPGPPLRLAPAPTPPRDPRKVAGGVLLGLGGVGLALLATGLAVGARAESRLAAARDADPGRDIDAILAEGLVQRGHAANNLAIAASVLAGVALVTGATLLVVARTPRRARVAALPGGLGLRF